MLDLPEAWRGAVPAPTMQRETASALGCMCIPSTKIVGGVLVVTDAIFRKGQKVQAFVLQKPGGLYVVVQPENMHPTTVSRCGGMLNKVAVGIPAAPLRAVFLRSDAYGGAPQVQKVYIPHAHVGAWYDSWNRAARDAWDEYSASFREALPWSRS